jgi:hypothetical protein
VRAKRPATTTVGIWIAALALIALCIACDDDASPKSATTVPTPAIPSGATLVDCKLSSDIRNTNEHGPWANRLLIATSPDSLVWTRTNTVLSNHADVPSGVVLPDGTVYVYFVSFCEGTRNAIVRASSKDLRTWTMEPVAITGVDSSWAPPVDPTVVRTDDGKFRIYFTTRAPGTARPATYSGTSPEGIAFALDPGPRFAADGDVLDPSVLRVRDGWAYFAGGGTSNVPNHAAFSKDGLVFTPAGAFDAKGLILANGVATADGYRYFGFEQKAPGRVERIGSLFSKDGKSWILDPGWRLEPDPVSKTEQGGVKDPAVIRLPSGGYLMVYVSGIPGTPDLRPPSAPPSR